MVGASKLHMASSFLASITIPKQRIAFTGPLCSDVVKKGFVNRYTLRHVVCALRDVDRDRVQTHALPSLQRTQKSGPPMDIQFVSTPLPSSDQLAVATRLIYALGMYVGLASFGLVVCNLSGAPLPDVDLSIPSCITALVYAAPPTLLTAILSQDFVVRNWDIAQAIRDSDDEEAKNFFHGMSPLQYSVAVFSAAVAEELFFRAGLQTGLGRALLMSAPGPETHILGMPSLTGFLPAFSPCSQVAAALLTAAIAGSLFYVSSAGSEPEVVVVLRNADRHDSDLRRRVGAWQTRQMSSRIYPPMFSGALALYFGMEWILTGNLLVPIFSHGLVSLMQLHLALERVEEEHKQRRMKRSNADH